MPRSSRLSQAEDLSQTFLNCEGIIAIDDQGSKSTGCTKEPVSYTHLDVYKRQGYEYQSIHYANKGDIVIAHVITNQSYYDIFYLDQADLSYAEVIYTVDGQQLAPVQLDLVDAKICYHQAPSDDYRLDVRYYDRNRCV